MNRTTFFFPFVAALTGLLAGCGAPGEKAIRQEVKSRNSVRDPEFRQSMGSLLGPSFVDGNRITTLLNGQQIFPAMLNAIAGAKKTITFETFVYWKGETGHSFAAALAERARAGVRTHVILDAHGANKIARRDYDLMKDAGVQVRRYHDVFWLDPRRYNNRTHRKLLVVDGRVGFTGGVGIADEWVGNADSPEHWRDSHYRVEGPVVAQMQAVFAENWLKTDGELLHGPDYFPPLAASGPYLAQMFGSSPRHGSVSVSMMYLLAISSAQKNIRIENAYFVPDRMLVDALAAAARRGVTVEIIVPGEKIDQKSVRHASRKRWGDLLEAGVKMYEYQPTMIHCKLLIADDLFVSVGSSNFDPRSLRLNDEANLNVLDARFAAEQTRIFNRDKQRCDEVTLPEWKNRSWLSRPKEAATGLAASQL